MCENISIPNKKKITVCSLQSWFATYRSLVWLTTGELHCLLAAFPTFGLPVVLPTGMQAAWPTHRLHSLMKVCVDYDLWGCIAYWPAWPTDRQVVFGILIGCTAYMYTYHTCRMQPSRLYCLLGYNVSWWATCQPHLS